MKTKPFAALAGGVWAFANGKAKGEGGGCCADFKCCGKEPAPKKTKCCGDGCCK